MADLVKSVLLCMISFVLGGCFASSPARHLSSDVCMLLPKQTTKRQVVQQLGSPNIRREDEAGETWIYYQVHKSMLADLPWLGDSLGSESYEVVTVTFTGTEVRGCVFRDMGRQEFQALGIGPEDRVDAE